MSIFDIGMRHLVEDGIAILEGREPAPARRAYVLADLGSVASDARDALAAAGEPLSVVGMDSARRMRRLCEIRTLLGVRDLRRLQDELASTAAALSARGTGVASTSGHDATAKRFLHAMLDALVARESLEARYWAA